MTFNCLFVLPFFLFFKSFFRFSGVSKDSDGDCCWVGVLQDNICLLVSYSDFPIEALELSTFENVIEHVLKKCARRSSYILSCCRTFTSKTIQSSSAPWEHCGALQPCAVRWNRRFHSCPAGLAHSGFGRTNIVPSYFLGWGRNQPRRWLSRLFRPPLICCSLLSFTSVSLLN